MKKIVAIGLIVVLIFSAVACGEKQNTSSWQEQYDLGMRYLSEGNYEEAIIAFETAINIESKHPEIYIGLAQSYLGLGDMETAEEVLLEGIDALGANNEFTELLDEIHQKQNENKTSQFDVPYKIVVQDNLDLADINLVFSYPSTFERADAVGDFMFEYTVNGPKEVSWDGVFVAGNLQIKNREEASSKIHDSWNVLHRDFPYMSGSGSFLEDWAFDHPYYVTIGAIDSSKKLVGFITFEIDTEYISPAV